MLLVKQYIAYSISEQDDDDKDDDDDIYICLLTVSFLVQKDIICK